MSDETIHPIEIINNRVKAIGRTRDVRRSLLDARGDSAESINPIADTSIFT